ncbi:MAG: NAD-binding protein [Pseudomonadales bacterium]
MPQDTFSVGKFPWRIAVAVFFFCSAIIGFEMGVAVTERPDVANENLLSKAYYSLSLFVVGGVDLGTPFGGPLIGRILLWSAYFGAPILAASTLVVTLLQALAPQSLHLRRLKDHVIVVGDGELVWSYLRVLRAHDPKARVVIVCATPEQANLGEFKESMGATVVCGDVTHAYFLKQLRVERARKVLLLDDSSLRSYEAASALIKLVPDIGNKVIIHCANLRFMRAMENTDVAKRCQTFNAYHLAAAGLVRSHLLHHFKETHSKDIVIIAGFGRFGQTILEELQGKAMEQLDTVIIIDIDIHRRVLVADEQTEFSGTYKRELFEGDVAHPDVWERVRREANVVGNNTVFVLATGREEDNLRTALWLRRRYPAAMVMARSSTDSLFAGEVGREHDLVNISITQLVEDNIPTSWID